MIKLFIRCSLKEEIAFVIASYILSEQRHCSCLVVKMVLTLSYGNASVEGGFSINKELLIDNMTEDTIVSQRVVFDVICSANMAVNKVEVTSKMIASVKQAHA